MLSSFLISRKRQSLVILHDVAQTALAWELALSMSYRLAGNVKPDGLIWITAVVVFIAAAVYYWRGLYRGIWHYASMRDLFNIAQSVALVIGIFAVVLFMITRLEAVPRSSLGYFPILLLVLLSVPRILYRAIKDGNLNLILNRPDSARVPILLVGAGDEADVFIREMGRNQSSSYRVVGLLATSEERVGRDIRGVRVLGLVSDMPKVLQDLKAPSDKPHRVIISSQKIEPQQVADVLKWAIGAGLTTGRLPKLTDFNNSQAEIDVRPIDVEDLLGRPQRVLDRSAIKSLVSERLLVSF